jgi:hypothetical protein
MTAARIRRRRGNDVRLVRVVCRMQSSAVGKMDGPFTVNLRFPFGAALYVEVSARISVGVRADRVLGVGRRAARMLQRSANAVTSAFESGADRRPASRTPLPSR